VCSGVPGARQPQALQVVQKEVLGSVPCVQNPVGHGIELGSAEAARMACGKHGNVQGGGQEGMSVVAGGRQEGWQEVARQKRGVAAGRGVPLPRGMVGKVRRRGR